MAYTYRYTVQAKIRSESGLTNTTNISTDRIDDVGSRSEGEIDTVLISLYTLPLADNDAWAGSPAQEYIEMIATELAVGMLLVEQYGVESEGTSKDGYEKLDRIRGNSKKGIVGEFELLLSKKKILIGTDGAELTPSTTLSPEGWPTNLTESLDTEDAGGAIINRIDTKF